MWDAFLKGYRQIRQITPIDLEGVHYFVIVRHVWMMGEYASRSQEWGSQAVDWIGREADFLKAWEAEHILDRLF